MNRTIDRLKLVFLGVFAVACVGVWAYQAYYVWPAERCEAARSWWDPETRTCARPIYIPDITGREPGETREQASLRRAAERNAAERRAAGGY